MMFKVAGAGMIIAACGSFGFKLAYEHRKKEHTLQQLIYAVEYMICEMEYHLTPLPALARQASEACSGVVADVLYTFSSELEKRLGTDICQCMTISIEQCHTLPSVTAEAMHLLSRNLGKFDAPGQLRGLSAVQAHCVDRLKKLQTDSEKRIRSYQTLALCAGAALTILFL